MDRWKGKIAVVTGASAGIGAAVAQRLVEEGLQVVGIARRVERIQDNANKLSDKKGKLIALKGDVTDPNDVINAFKWIKENVGPVNILINNAGIFQQTTLINGDIQMWKKVLDTNVLGLCIATREALTSMREHDIDGHIVHLNSLAGHGKQIAPKMNVYPASKQAVTALTESLRMELIECGSKIKITSISPGWVETEIAQTNNLTMEGPIVQIVQQIPVLLKPEDIADSIVYALSTPPHVQVHDIIIRPIGENF